MSAFLAELRAQRADAVEAAKAAADIVRNRESHPVGLRVRVVKGRKLPKGSHFVVQRAGEGRYGKWVQTPEGVFVDRYNVEIDDPLFAAAVADAARADVHVDDLTREIKAEEARIIAAAGIDLSKRDNRTLRQGAWRDYDEYDTVCSPLADDDLIRAALAYADPQGSSWGALRWSCGTSLVERIAPDRIRVCAQTGIAD
jgi:hypothetical protein